MGAWGYEVFEDDTAYDVIEEIERCSDIPAYLEKAFDTAIHADCLDYDEGIAAIVCSAVLDSALNKTSYKYAGFDENLGDTKEADLNDKNWFSDNFSPDTLKPKAISALTSVLKEESELCELWEENEELYPKWLDNIKGIIKRLS